VLAFTKTTTILKVEMKQQIYSFVQDICKTIRTQSSLYQYIYRLKKCKLCEYAFKRL